MTLCPVCGSAMSKYDVHRCWTTRRRPPNDERIADSLEKILLLLHKMNALQNEK